MEIKNPYLMFIGDVPDQLAAKTASGVAHWRPDWCVGQLRLDGCKADLGLPDMNVPEAAAAGVKTLIVGVTNQGGFFADSWVETMHSAIDNGMDIASGMHAKLDDVPGLSDKAAAAVCSTWAAGWDALLRRQYGSGVPASQRTTGATQRRVCVRSWARHDVQKLGLCAAVAARLP